MFVTDMIEAPAHELEQANLHFVRGGEIAMSAF
jgi:hypothetical protein